MTNDAHDPIRVAIAGCGSVARQVHLPILASDPRAQIVAIADASSSALAAAEAIAPNAAAHDDYQETIARDDVDAVVICLPTGMHAEAAVAALERGRHVYVEKPIATTRADADRVLRAWQSAGVVGMVGFNYRCHPLYADLKARVQAGAIGRVQHVRTTFTTAPHQLPGWKQQRATGGGSLLDQASHDVDLVRFLLGDDIAEVSADVQSRHSEDDHAALQLWTTGGVTVQMLVGFGSVDEATFEAYGEGGKLSVSRYGSLRVEHQGGGAQGPIGRLLQALPTPRGLALQWRRRRSPFKEPSFAAALGHFIEALRGEAAGSPDLADGYHSLAVVLAAEEAARARRPTAVAALPKPIESAAAATVV